MPREPRQATQSQRQQTPKALGRYGGYVHCFREAGQEPGAAVPKMPEHLRQEPGRVAIHGLEILHLVAVQQGDRHMFQLVDSRVLKRRGGWGLIWLDIVTS